MSKPSNILQKPSHPNIQVLRQKSKKLMMFPHHDGHLTRQLSHISNNEGYYHGGESASVPFEWESQPGTPKVIRFRENSLPPLTPPPSYYQNLTNKPTFNAKKNSSPKSNLLKAIFPKRATRNKGCVLPPLESPNSLSYSSSSSWSSSLSPRPKSYSVPSSPMVVDLRKSGEDDEDLYDVPARLSLCFGNARSRGWYSSSMFKKVLLGEFM